MTGCGSTSTGCKIFHEDPVLPANGYEGQNWQDDFQLTRPRPGPDRAISRTPGTSFLSNIHRVFQGDKAPSIEDDDTIDYFLGKRPSGKPTDSQVDLGFIVREVPDLVVLNDEAHHIHDPRMAWFKNIEDISNQLRLKSSKLSAQFDLTATPKHNNGAIFVQTISDYPLVEAIRQQVVKTPVLARRSLTRQAARAAERQVHRAIRRLSASRLPGMEKGLRRAAADRQKVGSVHDDR